MTATETCQKKPWVVVLGGCGFIGRNLVGHLVSGGLAAGVRLVDKVPPQMAWLNTQHTEALTNAQVEFVSANLINPVSCESALHPRAGVPTWDLVVNCAGETKQGQTDAVYKEGILTLSLNCARECERLRVGHYVEISSASVYSSTKGAGKEDDLLVEPWNVIAKWKLKVEQELKQMSSLKCTILRPVIVYGKADRRNLMPRIIIGGLYRRLGEIMKLMWGPDLLLNTVHVQDVCRAVWHVATSSECAGQTYNVVDTNNTTQGLLASLIANVYHVKCEYLGTAMSHLAKSDLPSVLDELNDKHLSVWAEACRCDHIENTPLDPTMTEDMLDNRNVCVDGGKLIATGFVLEHPVVTADTLTDIIKDYIEMGVFPKCMLQC